MLTHGQTVRDRQLEAGTDRDKERDRQNNSEEARGKEARQRQKK